MTKFELDLELKNFDKLVRIPKIIDSALTGWEKVNKSMKGIDDKTKSLTRELEKQGASAMRLDLIQKKASLAKMFQMAKNPTALVGLGVNKIYFLLLAITKIGWIGLLTTAAAIIMKIGQLIWRFNIGGIATSFYKVYNIIQVSLNKAMLNFVKLMKELDPIIRPVINILTSGLINIIKSFSDMTSGAMKNKDVLEKIKAVMMTWQKLVFTMFRIYKQLFEGIKQGFQLGNTESGNFFDTILDIADGFYRIYNVIYIVIEKLKIFKIIGIALGVTFKALYNIINSIVIVMEKMIKVGEAFGNVLSKIQQKRTLPYHENTKAIMEASMGQNAVGNQYNNNFVYHSPSPINEDSAERIANTTLKVLTSSMSRG